MDKETKNSITRESCQKSLFDLLKLDLILYSVLFAIMLLLFIPIIIAILSAFPPGLLLVAGVIISLLFLLAPGLLLRQLLKTSAKMRLLKRGKFSIVRDTVYRLAQENPRNHSEGRSLVHVIYFTTHGRCTCSEMDFVLACAGDEFYLMVLHGKKDEVVNLFSAKRYEYK